VSCPKMEKLKFNFRVAKAEADQQHSVRRLFLESFSQSADVDDHLLAFLEDLVVAAEMKRTRACLSLDQHTHICLFCSHANSN
jgi:hypothetical protein